MSIIILNNQLKNMIVINKIWVLDDSEMMRTFLKMICDKIGDTELFGDPVSFLERILKEECPAVILLDLNLPNIHGLDLLQTLSNARITDKCKIIVISSSDKSEEKIKCLNLGANDFICKPFHPEELEIKLRRAFSSNNAQQAKLLNLNNQKYGS